MPIRRNDLTAVLDREINQLEHQLSALKSARDAIAGVGGARRGPGRPPGSSGRAGRRPGQRTFTAAQRAEQSRKMKQYWAKRRREQGS